MRNKLYEIKFFDLCRKKLELMKQNHLLKIGLVIFLKGATFSDFVGYRLLNYIVHTFSYPNLHSTILGEIFSIRFQPHQAVTALLSLTVLCRRKKSGNFKKAYNYPDLSLSYIVFTLGPPLSHDMFELWIVFIYRTNTLMNLQRFSLWNTLVRKKQFDWLKKILNARMVDQNVLKFQARAILDFWQMQDLSSHFCKWPSYC